MSFTTNLRGTTVYFRFSENTFFVFPTMAVGLDTKDDYRVFLEFAWGFWAIGIGDPYE